MQKLISNYTEVKRITTTIHLHQAHTEPSLMVEVYIAQMEYNCIRKVFLAVASKKTKKIQVIHKTALTQRNKVLKEVDVFSCAGKLIIFHSKT